MTKTTVYTLIVWAYGSNGLHSPGCGLESRLNLIAGGPAWIKSELYDVEATIPEGVVVGTRASRDASSDTAVRQMLRTLLADRFALTVRRETREVPVYSLSVRDALTTESSSGPVQWLTKAEGHPEDKRLGGSLRDPGVIADTGLRNGELMQVFSGRNASIAEFAALLGPSMGRTVLDRTGLVRRFNFDFWVALVADDLALPMFRSTPRATSPTIFAALADAGLRLEPSPGAVGGTGDRTGRAADSELIWKDRCQAVPEIRVPRNLEIFRPTTPSGR